MIMVPDKIRFQVEQMTGQNIKKYQQKELNLRCIKTDKKTRSYIFFLCRATKAKKIEHAKTKPKTKFPFFYYSG